MTDITNTNTQDTATPNTAQDTLTSAAKEGQNQSAKTYTQAELDQMMGERAKRAQESTTKKLLSALGLTSEAEIETLKATITEAQSLKQSQMSEAEKANEALKKATQTITDLQAKLTERETFFRQKEISGAVKEAVTAMKANDFDAIYLWAEKYHAEALNAVMGEDDKVDAKALEKLLDAVKKDKPGYFTPVTQHMGSQSNANGYTRPSEAEAMKRASAVNQRIIRGG